MFLDSATGFSPATGLVNCAFHGFGAVGGVPVGSRTPTPNGLLGTHLASHHGNVATVKDDRRPSSEVVPPAMMRSPRSIATAQAVSALLLAIW